MKNHWLPDVKSQLTGKNPDAVKDWMKAIQGIAKSGHYLATEQQQRWKITSGTRTAKIKNKNLSFCKYNDNTLKNLFKSINQPFQISEC